MGKFIALPAALQNLASKSIWMLYKLESRQVTKNGITQTKITKVPYRAADPRRKAASNNPATWSPFGTALAAYNAGLADGLGFAILGAEVGAFDLDGCRDLATGELLPEARELVDKAKSYTEITPSDTGLRIILRAKGAKLHRAQLVPNVNGMKIETYRKCARFITVTGNILPGVPDQLVDGDALLEETVARLDAANKAAKKAGRAKRAKGKKSKLDLDDIIKNGEGGHFAGNRSAAVWWVIHELLRKNTADSDILTILLDRNNKISDHVYDQSNPQDYAERQIAQAHTARIDWRTRVIGGTALIAGNVTNVLLALREDDQLRHVVGYDEMLCMPVLRAPLFASDPNFEPRPLIDADTIQMLVYLQGEGMNTLSREIVQQAIELRIRECGFHPVVDYLRGLQWDGTERLSSWMSSYLGSADTDYSRGIGRMFLNGGADPVTGM